MAVNAIDGLSASFEKGKIYCVAGPSGSGKSTLFSAILGLVKHSSGAIECQSKKGVLDITYMPQKVKLAPLTVSENVCYPHRVPDPARVEKALREVDLLNFIKSMPSGVDTEMGPNNFGLSGGQAQRLLFARLFYHQSPLILVDEGTSALDPKVEASIYGYLNKLKSDGCTIIMIAHRQSGLRNADEILMLKDGKMNMFSSRDEVLSRWGDLNKGLGPEK